MKRLFSFALFFAVPLSLASCAPESAPEQPPELTPMTEEEEVPAPVIEAEDLVTKNVTYSGILELGGVTIYQEGSHRLMLSDGKMVLLGASEDSSADLDLYAGKLVRVRGDVMPTVEAGGTIMEVREIHWIRREKDADGNEEEVLRVLCGRDSQCSDGETCVLSEEGPGVCMMVASSSASSESSSPSTEEDEQPPVDGGEESGGGAESSPAVPATNGAYGKAIELMLAEDYAADRWTQEYCTAHVGFCVPVHKNWYYKSFGAMSTVLWHVEIGAVDVQEMGDGPLVVELKSGDLTALGLADRDMKVIGEKAIGYRSFSDGRHFEISSVKELQTPVMHVTEGLKVTAGE